MSEVRFVGMEDLGADSANLHQVKSYAEKYSARYQQMVDNEIELVLHTKAYQKAGDRQKFAVNVRLSFPGGTINSSKDDWQLPVAVKVALEAVEEQVRHRFGN